MSIKIFKGEQDGDWVLHSETNLGALAIDLSALIKNKDMHDVLIDDESLADETSRCVIAFREANYSSSITFIDDTPNVNLKLAPGGNATVEVLEAGYKFALRYWGVITSVHADSDNGTADASEAASVEVDFRDLAVVQEIPLEIPTGGDDGMPIIVDDVGVVLGGLTEQRIQGLDFSRNAYVLWSKRNGLSDLATLKSITLPDLPFDHLAIIRANDDTKPITDVVSVQIIFSRVSPGGCRKMITFRLDPTHTEGRFDITITSNFDVVKKSNHFVQLPKTWAIDSVLVNGKKLNSEESQVKAVELHFTA